MATGIEFIRSLQVAKNQLSPKLNDAPFALSRIKDGSVVAVSGFNMPTTPEYLIMELFRMYCQTGHPKQIFVISDALPAVPGRALDRVAQDLYRDSGQDFLRGALLPFLGFSPWLQKLVTEDRIECYGWPLGIAAYWFREVASGRPGLVTKIGLDTFLDPRQDGAALNRKGMESGTCKVSVIDIGGEEHLLYRAPKPDFALVRASSSDENGNLSMEDEGIRGTVFSIAQAAKARPGQGTVIAQIRWMAVRGAINPRDVDVPAPLVDHIVMAPREFHWQAGTTEYDPRFSYKVRPPLTLQSVEDLAPVTPKDSEKVIARRVLLELAKLVKERRGPILVNLGIGIPSFVSLAAAEEGVLDLIQVVLESGPWGGIALSGPNFGLAVSPFALSTIPDMFSNFEGGIIDAACLGFLEVDRQGNVNPSILPGRVFGPGGFPVIAGGAPRTFFAGSFTAGPSEIGCEEGKLRIRSDGSITKFLESVFKVVFSGRQAVKYGHEILYVTERAVFRLGKDGLTLEEFAPGVDVDKDILRRMGFAPSSSSGARQMDARLFREGPMGLQEELAGI